MAKTAVVNRRRRRSHRRRRNYGAAAVANPRRRRRRRRNYGAAAANPRRRRSHRRGRRRNPATPYSSGGYRRPNPGMFSFHDLIDIVPSGTLGVWGARFALKQSGSFGKEPGVWQAVALWIGAHLTGSIVGSMFGSTKGLYAKIGALSYGGDMFARTRLFQNSDWIEKNLSLAGDDDEGYSDEALMEGFQPASALGDDGEDRGWALAGMGAPGEIVRDGQGNLYQLSGGMGLDSGPGSGSRLAGFQQASALGGMRANPNSNSSFGYSP